MYTEKGRCNVIVSKMTFQCQTIASDAAVVNKCREEYVTRNDIIAVHKNHKDNLTVLLKRQRNVTTQYMCCKSLLFSKLKVVLISFTVSFVLLLPYILSLPSNEFHTPKTFHCYYIFMISKFVNEKLCQPITRFEKQTQVTMIKTSLGSFTTNSVLSTLKSEV